MYFISAPFWLRAIYRSLVWKIPDSEKTIYLTFDDGPHPIATPFVLDQLKKYNAKACFFCIGKNVDEEKIIYERILREGHRVGNHTQNHLNGWKVTEADYLKNIETAAERIQSNLFRPPYGRIRLGTIQKVKSLLAKRASDRGDKSAAKIIMWDVLSGDFDRNISKEQCLKNVLKFTSNGSIVVFHDSTKAWERLEFTLPRTLEYFSEKGYQFKVIPE